MTVFNQYQALQKPSSIFMSESASKDVIEKAAYDDMLVIYSTTTQTLNAALVANIQLKVATSSGFVPPKKLPPMEDAAVWHSHRTYHQVQAWCGNDISPDVRG